MRELADYARRNNIRIYLAMMPDVHNLVDYKFGFVHDIMRKIAETDGYAYVDLLPALLGHPPEQLWAMPGDPHPNAFGHQLMANAAIFPGPGQWCRLRRRRPLSRIDCFSTAWSSGLGFCQRFHGR